MTIGDWAEYQLSLPEEDRTTVELDGGRWKVVGEQNGYVLMERVGSYYGPGNPMYEAIIEIIDKEWIIRLVKGEIEK